MAIDLDTVETHEDIQAAVKEAVAEVAADEAEDTSDSQKLAADGDREAAERDDKTNKPEPETEEESESEEEPDERKWLDDDLKKQVAAHGIDEDELDEFTSREEVERAMRFLDKSAQEAGKKSQEKTPGKVKSDGDDTDETKPEGQYEVKLDKEEWTPELVEEFTRMRDHYDKRESANDARFEVLEARFAEQDAELEEAKFDSLIDSLGHEDLFGKTGKETKKELKHREDVIVAAKAQQIGLEQLGRPVDLDGALMARVANMVFADELGKKALKARTRKVAKQSNSRMGGSATKAHETAETAEEKAIAHYKRLEESG